MMDKFKRFITPAAAALMALSMPFLVHAASSENSVTDLNTEGNVQCNDYAGNKVIKSMDTSSLVASGTLSGPENPEDEDSTGESTPYEYDSNTISFGESTTPIDFLLIKSSKAVKVFWYIKGGVFFDSVVAFDDFSPISSVSLCYGLGNEAEPVLVNQPPVLNDIGDKVATIGDLIEFTVTATDELDMIDDMVTITASNIPVGASFTSTAALDSTTGLFSWTTDLVGSTNVTFTANDGAAIVTETISITVNDIPPEPVATPTCESIQSLDNTGISCPAPVLDDNGVVINRSLACNFELDKKTTDDELNAYGTADGSDVCCICNNGTPLVECDATRPPTNDPITSGLPPCTLTLEQKALQNLPPSEVSTFIELNKDPYYCITSLGSRTCYYYSYPF